MDTNIFIGNLGQLKGFLESPLAADANVILYVPWTVLRELDSLKKRMKEAPRAIDFLLGALKREQERDLRIRFQTLKEEKVAVEFARAGVASVGDDVADDRILYTTLRVKSACQFSRVLLYTNDKNLAIKAKVSGIDSAWLVASSYAALVRLTLSPFLFHSSKDLKHKVWSISNQTRENPGAKDELVALAVNPDRDMRTEVLNVESSFEQVWVYIHAYT